MTKRNCSDPSGHVIKAFRVLHQQSNLTKTLLSFKLFILHENNNIKTTPPPPPEVLMSANHKQRNERITIEANFIKGSCSQSTSRTNI